MTRHTIMLLITLVFSLLATALAATAPVGKVPQIGLLAPRSPSTFVTEIATF